MVNEMRGGVFGVEEGCCAVHIEDGGKVEVAVAKGEVAEENNTVVWANRGCVMFLCWQRNLV